ncbi:MAG: TlpA disulfide reductase family protein [Candidatus Coatesbacteria bacterium]
MEPETGGALVEAGRLLEAGDLDGAVRACQRALRIMPGSFPAHLRLTQIYGRKFLRSRDPVVRRLAEREFAEAMRLAPADETVHNALFDVAVETGQADALRARYLGEWAGLPFAKPAVRRLEESGPVLEPIQDPETDPLRKIAIGTVFVIVASLAWQFGPPLWHMLERRMAPPGDPALQFALDDLSGHRVALADFRGKAVVVVDFWATWCGPCRASLPALHNLRKKYRGQGVEVLNLSLDDDPSVVAPYLAQEQLDLWVLLDRGHAVARAWGVSGIPSIFVIDKNGMKREQFVGYSPDLEARIEQLVNELR